MTVGAVPGPLDADGHDDARPETISLRADSPAPTTDALSGRGALHDAVGGDDATIHRLGGLARYFTALP